MKQHTSIEMHVPRNSRSLPDLKDDGGVELCWELPNGSYVRLLFEDGGPVHEMYARLIGLEKHRELSEEEVRANPDGGKATGDSLNA